MSRHVSAETLARRQEGVLSARKAARIDAHMSACVRCTGIQADQSAVSSLLAATQLPPMPDALAQRVQMAIATESEARMAATAGLGAQAHAADVPKSRARATEDSAAQGAGESTMIPGRPDLPARSSRAGAPRRFRLPSLSSPLLLRGLAATAAIVVIAGVGFVLANGQAEPTKSAHHNAAGRPYSGGRRVPSVAPNAPISHARPVGLHYRLNGQTARTTAIVTNANFRRKSLAPLVRKDVRQATRFSENVGGTVAASPGPQASNLSVGFSIPQMENCLSRVNAGRTVLLATVARFLGKRATVIVLKSLKSAALLDIAIVGPACSASNPHVIFQTTIPAG